MRVQPSENDSHEVQLKKLRLERNSEERRLGGLKFRLENKLTQRLRILPALPSKDEANVA